MKHQKAIQTIFSFFHESWMNQEDRDEFDRELLKSSGKTMEQWDADIEYGVLIGYSVEMQIEISKQLIKQMNSKSP